MASILKVDTLTGVTTAGSISVTGEGNSTTTNLQQGLTKMWCNTNQNNHTIADSFNTASVTDVQAGHTRFNYSSSMATANFAPQSNGFDDSNYAAQAVYELTTSRHASRVNGFDLEGVWTCNNGDLA